MKSLNSQPRKPQAEPTNLAPVRVLLVDDDEDEFIITRRLLSEIEGRKHILDWVATYDEALDELQKGSHDIYLIDYRLSEQTGLDLLRKAQEMECTSPMILLTGQEDRTIDIEAMKAGAWDYLVKGHIDAASLERSIRYTLEHKRVLDVLLESERQREKFIATLTHDLKTPIKAEFRIFELLLQERFGPMTEEQTAVVTEMLKSNRFMYQMVDNLLQAFKYEEGGLDLRLERVDLNDQLHSIISMELQGLAQDKNQTLTVAADPTLPLVSLDTLEFKRLIYNLVQNAVSYTPKNGSIVVSTRTEPDGKFVTVSVKDSGQGIEPSMMREIFKPYATNAKRYRHIGTGLGLYICKTIVEAHGGTIRVDSQPGNGSNFIFTLPVSQEMRAPDLPV